MKRPVISTAELLRTNPQLRELWEKDRKIRLNQPSRTSEEAIAQALEMKRVAGLRDSNSKNSASGSGPQKTTALAEVVT